MIATIDLGGTRTKYGLVNDGNIVCASSFGADPHGSLQAHLGAALGKLREMCIDHNTKLEACGGIGVLSTGLVDNRNMRVLSTNEKYNDAVDFDFLAWASDRTGLQLRLENDARGALIGGWLYGAGRGVDNLIMMTIGTGIGTAVIINGKPLTGPHFSGGNLGGHIVIRSGGRWCTCGGVGCLEAEASGWALPALVREHPLFQHSSLRKLDSIGFSELADHAANGDECAAAVQDHCRCLWGDALVSFIHLLDPQRIIIGGGVMNNPKPVLESLRNTVAKGVWTTGQHADIVAAQFPDYAGLLGAEAMFRLCE